MPPVPEYPCKCKKTGTASTNLSSAHSRLDQNDDRTDARQRERKSEKGENAAGKSENRQKTPKKNKKSRRFQAYQDAWNRVDSRDAVRSACCVNAVVRAKQFAQVAVPVANVDVRIRSGATGSLVRQYRSDDWRGFTQHRNGNMQTCACVLCACTCACYYLSLVSLSLFSSLLVTSHRNDSHLRDGATRQERVCSHAAFE